MTSAPTPQPTLPATKPHAGLIAASLVSGAIALFMVMPSLREIFAAINHGKFVPDTAVILNWDFAAARASSPRARIVSSGEEILIDRYWIMDLDEAQALERDGKLEGHAAPVFYFPAASPWTAIDSIVAFRVLSPEQHALGFSAALPISTLVLAALSVALFRRGARRVEKAV